jgi:hypothetical protein
MVQFSDRLEARGCKIVIASASEAIHFAAVSELRRKARGLRQINTTGHLRMADMCDLPVGANRPGPPVVARKSEQGAAKDGSHQSGPLRR